MMDFLTHCRSVVGDAFVLDTPADMAPFLTDWRGRFTGKALAVLRPASVDQVATLVRACAQWRVPLVPQGGRTGLVLGSVPDASGTAVVLSLARLNTIREIDIANRTMTVAGGGRQLFHRRQPVHQRGRHGRSPLRQYTRTVPGPGSGDAAGRHLERP